MICRVLLSHVLEKKAEMAGWSESIWNLLQELKTLYLHFHNDYGYQTWLGGDLPWETPTHKVTWPSDHVVLQDHLINESHYISIIRVYMATKLDRIVTYLNGLLLLYTSDSLITCSCYITWQIKNISLLSTTTIPMTTKLSKVAALPLKKLHNPSIPYFERSRDILNTLYLHLH